MKRVEVAANFSSGLAVSHAQHASVVIGRRLETLPRWPGDFRRGVATGAPGAGKAGPTKCSWSRD